ncbi:hypothetical protein B7P43_G05744 [Cryptotermes secundus]|uniref:Mariner Mos1 transposase n=1 Tax=Cryptotermes secundus TaxID=105785 RepID=A0A2J7QU13_9NEOP|nr:hypothetical protein B7P43_G05744 [Cryptotermes secundus]
MRRGVTTMSRNPNRQSMEWRHPDSPRKKKFKTQPLAGKVMCTVFWDRRGVIFLDILEPGETVNSERYKTTLTKLKARISRVRPEKQTTFCLQHDNARPHTSLAGLSNHIHLIAPI